MPRPITQCRICGNPRLELVLQLGEQKLTGVFPGKPDQVVLGGPLDLVRCLPSANMCGLLQLRHSYPLDEMYGENYGYRSGLNSSMVRHLALKAASLAALCKPSAGDLIVDIGSNDGTLLKSYGSGFELVGIDPVARKFLSFYPPTIRVVPEFFSRELWQGEFRGRTAKIITSVAMFYDIERPLEFMRTVRDCLASDGVWHFEQSYMPLMLERCAYDTICHEHIEYYSLRQIQWMTDRSDLKIIGLQASEVNGGSLAVTVARTDAPYREAKTEIERMTQAEQRGGFEGIEPFHRFRDEVFAHRDKLLEQIHRLRREGRKLAGYGASTKGNVLLQFCRLTSREIPVIAEVNSEKFGHFTPGTGIPIVSEPEMHALKPDVLLVLPWHFRENLIDREEDFLKRGGRLLFPLPKVEFFPVNPLVIIPTYNERNNVTPISGKILELGVSLDILFVDDNSPDGTGAVLDGISAKNPSVTVLHRKKKEGIGAAHVAGLRWARERGYDTVVTMDCDLTHSPEDIPRLLESSRFADVIVGSRYLRPGSLRGWNVRRKLLTRIAHLLTRFFLAIPYDATGAFRAYRLDRLPADIFEIVRSKTYPFFFESLFVLHANGIAVLEIPIDLPPRTYGSSKMPASEPLHGIRYLLEMAILRKICPEVFLCNSRVVEAHPLLRDDQGWDIYWSEGTGAGNLLYRIVATLYRRTIIAGRLSATIRRTFAPGSKLLHAGCGSGQVDVSFQNEMRITAVDSSLRALETYVRTVPYAKSVRHASIKALPYEAASFDGIYNLGVMEHFPEDEIVAIVREFRRVLRPEGRLLLFWPHARATSVAVLRLWRSLRSLHSRANVPLHPPEVSLVRSKKWLAELLAKAGFELESYEFDWRDFWVQAVVTARPSP